MKKSRIDVPDLWDNLSGDNTSILFAAFIDESRGLTEKWNKGNEHVTFQEKRAVGKFLVDIGAILLQVKEEKKKGTSQIKAEVHCIRMHREEALLASQQEAAGNDRKEEKYCTQDETVVADSPSSPPNVATDDVASDVLNEHESHSCSPSWSGGGEDVSDEDDDWGSSSGKARSNVLLNEVSEVKKIVGTVGPSKCSLEASNVEVQSEDANDYDDGALLSGVNQLEHEGMGGTISTIESSQVQVESAAEMQAAVTLHKCKLCHSSFPTMWQLDLHVFKCKLMLYYYCPLCDKPYRRKTNLSGHLHWTHDMAATDIIERLRNLAGHPREKQKKKILHGEARSTKRPRKKIARKQDQKDPDYVKNLSKARKHKKGKRINADNPSLHVNKKIEFFQRSGKILTRSSARKLRDSASVLDSSANEVEEGGSGFSSDTSADSGREEVKNDTPAPGLDEGGNESDSHQKEQIDSEMECSDVGDITAKGHLGPRDANCDTTVIANSPGDRGGIACADSPTRREGKTQSLDDDASSKQEETREKRSTGKKCHLCGETFGSAFGLQCHIRADHLGDRFACSTCGKKFVALTSFKTHLEQHSDPEGAPYKCDMCNASFKNKQSLLIHRDFIHLKKCDFTCEICHVVLSSKGALKKHTNSLHTKEVKYPCEQCDRVFYERCRLKEHMLIHTGIKRVKCDQCDLSFYRQRQLDTHKRNVHIPSDTYLCDLCGARYKSEGNLKQHHLTAHTDTFNFTCDLCGKKFKRKTHLNRHMEVHLDLRPHKCQLCEKSFRKPNNLKVHMDWHNDVRAHKCSMCDMAFLTKGNLNKHMQKHQKTRTNTCEECGHAFPDLTALRRHLAKVHSVIVESKLTKAPTRVSSVPQGAKTAGRPDSSAGAPTEDALSHNVQRVSSEADSTLLAPGSQIPVVAAPDLSTAVAAHDETQGVSLGMQFVANSCVEESIPVCNVEEEGQATKALMGMMLPSL